MQRVITWELSADPSLEVVATASDALEARDEIVYRQPDVVVLDLHLPGMDGIAFLRKLMRHYPLPVVVFSADAGARALEALAAGAVAVVAKPARREDVALARLRGTVAEAGRTRLNRAQLSAPRSSGAGMKLGAVAWSHDIQVFGASTGGTVALEQILAVLPQSAPGTLIAQHMPEGFTASFAERLDGISAMRVREARAGDRVERGVALVAPGNRHLLVSRGPSGLVAALSDGPAVNRHRPSVDVLMASVAEVVGRAAVGVLLTGMGADGARGLLAMRRAGARTIAQDEASSVVYGMPRAAAECGAAGEVLPLGFIASALTGARPAVSTPA